MLNVNIDIVIPTTGKRNKILLLLIKSILNQNLSHQESHPIINIKKINIYISINPIDEILEKKIISEFQNYDKKVFEIKIIQNKKVGVNEARQNGLDSGKEEIIFFFDDDCELRDKNLLLEHLYFHQLNKNALAIGGLYQYLSSEKPSLCIHYYHEQISWYKRGLINLHTRESAYLFGGHFSMKRQLAEINHLSFDTSMKFGGTEKEFFLQALSKKQILIQTNLPVAHHYEFGYLSYLKKIFNQGQGNAYIASKGLSFKPQHKVEEKKPPFIYFLFDTAYWLGYYSVNNQWHLFIKSKLRLPKF